MKSAAGIGRSVLDEGRRRAIELKQEQAARHRRLIIRAALADIKAGGQRRGRAGRIRQRLCGMLSARQINRILDSIYPSMSGSKVVSASVSDSAMYDATELQP